RRRLRRLRTLRRLRLGLRRLGWLRLRCRGAGRRARLLGLLLGCLLLLRRRGLELDLRGGVAERRERDAGGDADAAQCGHFGPEPEWSDQKREPKLNRKSSSRS
ncbi:MAG: hypothetical protein ACKOGH_03945, partial [Alphaproteobacteria bacterium]